MGRSSSVDAAALDAVLESLALVLPSLAASASSATAAGAKLIKAQHAAAERERGSASSFMETAIAQRSSGTVMNK